MKHFPLMLALMALALSSCTFGDLVDYVDGAGGNSDLTSNPDPEVQAAGAAAEEGDDESAAQKELGQALQNDLTDRERIEHAEEAASRRPLDPYYIYNRLLARWLLDPDGFETGQIDTVNYLVVDSTSSPDEAEQKRVEIILTSQVRWIESLRATEAELSSDQLENLEAVEEVFCQNRTKYSDNYGGTLTGVAVLASVQTNAVTC